MKSYPCKGFAAVYSLWSERRQQAYENEISRLLKGGHVTREAHEAALAVANRVKDKLQFDRLREAVDKPEMVEMLF